MRKYNKGVRELYERQTMRKFACLMYFFALSLFFPMAILWAESLSAHGPVVSSCETVDDSKTSGKDMLNKNEKTEPADSKQLVSERLSIKNATPEVPFDETVIDNKVSDKNTMDKDEDGEEAEPEESEEMSEATQIKDPLQSVNRAMFVFNDKAFHYFFKPIYTGYNSMIPVQARVSVRNFYTNITMPISFFNCLFQSNFKGAGTEMLRFVVNSTIGVGGFLDPAKSRFNIIKQNRDFGQTLGKYKMESGTYLVLPFLGPSTSRDAIGLAGDAVLNPLTWVSWFFLTPIESIGNYMYDSVNDLSIDTGDTYESITKPAIDPYVAVQDAYIQNRVKKVKD